MNQTTAEKRLSLLYGVGIVLGIICIVTPAIAWSHWGTTIDQCIYRNCSCILFGEHTPVVFHGGTAAPCIFVTYGPVFYVLFAFAFFSFHTYRVFCNNNATKARTIMRKNSEGDTVHMAVQTEDAELLPKKFWITITILTGFWSIFTLIHFIVFLSGYYKTCNEYRKTLEHLLGMHGTALPVIYNRLSCASIFDFMDYIQPIPENTYRDSIINTGLDLIIGLFASFLSCVVFIFSAIINYKRFKIDI